MTRLGLLLLFAATAFGQSELRIDLSGAWQYSFGDQPAYAEPSFDDSQWKKLEVPQGQEWFWGERYWLRRTVQLPSGAQNLSLALTVGTIQDVYEVYVGGRLIGATGNFESFRDARTPRPRSFRIPPDLVPRQGLLQLALRIRGALFLHPDWRLPDAGPWEITSHGVTRWQAGEQQIEARRVTLASDLWFSAVLLVLAVVSLFGWIAERRQMDLLWFAAICLVRAIHEGFHYLVFPDAQGAFTSTGIAIHFAASTFDNPLLAEFTFAALGIRKRWMHVVVWGVWLIVPLSQLLAPDPSVLPYTALPANAWCALLVVGVVLWEWRRASSLATEQHLFRAALLIAALSEFQVWTVLIIQQVKFVPGTRFHLAPPQFFVGQYAIKPDGVLWLLVSVMILVLLFRRLSAGRRKLQRLASEMEAARVIQRLLLANNQLRDPSLKMEAVYLPAQEVGGDFYYVLDGETVLLGDVSGKGLKAAMLVSLLIGVLRNTAERSPGKVLSACNSALAGQTDGGFVTCCCVHFNGNGTAAVASAGHLSPYLNGADAAVEPALPLGLDATAEYRETILPFAGGEVLTLVSDGVVEAADAKAELFGFDRTASVAMKSARDIAEAARAWGQNDDITVVTVRREA